MKKKIETDSRVEILLLSFSSSFLVCFMSVFDFMSAIYSKGERYAGFNYFTLFLYHYLLLDFIC